MKQYYIQVRDRITGQGKHASDLFDNFKDAVDWAKQEYGPCPDFNNEDYWVLEELEILKGRCPYYYNAKPCEGDVKVEGSSLTCMKCGRTIPLFLEM